MKLKFNRIDEKGATGTYAGKPFEVIAEQRESDGSISHGIVKGDFSFGERVEIFNEWEMRAPTPKETERREIAEKIIRCIEFCKEEMQRGASIEGVEYGDLEELKIAVETVMM